MFAAVPSPSFAVQNTRELQRVLSLPRRAWTEEEGERLADEMTARLKLPHGTMRLFPIQAISLFELWQNGSLFAPIGTGAGKTLTLALAPYILNARRPLEVVPAKLVEKTRHEHRELAKHWPIPNYTRIVSYESISIDYRQEIFHAYQPDFIGFDEVHKARNPGAARTKKIKNYLEHNPTRVLLTTGTISKRSIKDFAHFLRWALHEKAPVPLGFGELQEWAEALDDFDESARTRRRDVGYLRALMNGEEQGLAPIDGARKAFRRRLVETSGVVATSENLIGASLTLQEVGHEVSSATEEAFKILNGSLELDRTGKPLYPGWETPDRIPLSTGLEIYRVARELSLGFFYRWQPYPPKEWIEKRRTWSRASRYILGNNRRNLDSGAMVVRAVEEGQYPEVYLSDGTVIVPKIALEEWRAIEPTFTPNKIAVWFGRESLDFCAAWAHESPGIVWCEHVEFAKELAKLAKLTYYGAGSGDRAMYHDPRTSFIASQSSLNEGLNLQAYPDGRSGGGWSRNLLTSFPPNALQTEQILARTHRTGQEAEEVTFDAIVNSAAQFEAYEKALNNAKYQEQLTGQKQKILYADRLMPTWDDLMRRQGERWR